MAGRVQIEILAGPKVGEAFDFDCEAVGMGRSAQCQLQIPSPHVSRKQCELSWQGDQLVLENLGSVNHTYLNDRPIDRAYVQDGDLVTFCDIALRIRLPELTPAPSPSAGVAIPPNMAGPDGATHVVPHPTIPPISNAQDTHPPGHRNFVPGQLPQNPLGGASGFASTGRNPAVAGQLPGGGAQDYGGQGPAQSQYPGVVPGPHQHPGQPQSGYPGVPGQPQGGYPGVPGQPQGGYPGVPGQPGRQQSSQYVPRPPGMPGMPPGASSLQSGAPQAKAGRPRRKSRGGARGNSQLIRNLAIAGGAVLVLLLIAVAVGTRVLSKAGGQRIADPAPGTSAPPVEEGPPLVERGDRSNEDIIRQAQEDYQRGQVYFREAAVGDENLWESIRFYQRAEAELGLVDSALWPPFAREIAPKIQRAQGQLDQEYRRIKMSFVGRANS